MKAMILAAGLGTRLKPITENIPKALVEINGSTLLEKNIKNLISSGIKDIIINVHHLPDKIIDFVKSKNYFGINITFSDERDKLLETGGGLKKASWFFADSPHFIVQNVDILSNINYSELFTEHLKNKALATLAVRTRESSRFFLFDENNILCGWQNTIKNETIITRNISSYKKLAFSGIQIISNEIFKYMPELEYFSLTNLYIKLSENHIIKAYVHDYGYWFDVGKLQTLRELEKNGL